MNLTKGDKAPSFTLYASDKSEVSLSDYKGRNVVLLFFPLAFTSVCTKELCMTRDEIGIYGDLDADILAISVDTVATLNKFNQENQFNFKLLSDFNKEVARSYGCLYEEFGLGMRGVAKRSAFVIDRSGTIQYAEVLENAGKMPDFEKIKEKLSSLP